MGTRTRYFFGRFALVASVLGITLLGNLRLQASERPLAVGDVARSQPSTRDPFGLEALRAATVRAYGSDADDVAVDDGAATNDDGRLVPAIYAWDPDVRFVYFRHVSKWM